MDTHAAITNGCKSRCLKASSIDDCARQHIVARRSQCLLARFWFERCQNGNWFDGRVNTLGQPGRLLSQLVQSFAELVGKVLDWKVPKRKFVWQMAPRKGHRDLSQLRRDLTSANVSRFVVAPVGNTCSYNTCVLTARMALSLTDGMAQRTDGRSWSTSNSSMSVEKLVESSEITESSP